ncbi:MAG: hypothetical protein JXM79_05415, partial [Sedimentisphaerales bacterium]|nr:hypothetical protein [Sedimentisphaerales bacterium]
MSRFVHPATVLKVGLSVVCCLCMTPSTFAGSIVGWGSNRYGQVTPPDGNDFVAIAAGDGHSLALKSDGSLVGWGRSCIEPPDGNDFVAIAAGGVAKRKMLLESHCLALKSNGSIVAWSAPGISGLFPPTGNDFVAIAAGGSYCLALKNDGSIVGWGDK